MRLHFSIGGYDYRWTSRFRQRIHFSITQVLYAEHVHRRSRVDNKFSFLRFELMQAGTYFPKRRRMLLFHAPLILTLFWPASTLLHGHIGLATLSPPETDSHFFGAYADAVHLGKSFQAKDFCLECQHDVRRLSWIEHIGLFYVCLSFSAKSMKTSAAPYPENETQLSCNFQHSHCTFVIIIFGLSAGLFFNLEMRMRALLTKSAPTLGLVEQAFWKMPSFTEWVIASSSEVILARPSRHSTTWTSSSGTSDSRRISLILLHERIRRRIWWCNFSTLIDIVAETMEQCVPPNNKLWIDEHVCKHCKVWMSGHGLIWRCARHTYRETSKKNNNQRRLAL